MEREREREIEIESERSNITIYITKAVRYLTSNGAVASVIHHDLDIHFQGHEI